MFRNIIGRIFNAKKSFVFPFFSFIFDEKSHSPCRKKKIFEKHKQKKRKLLDGFSTQKRAIFGRIFNSTAYIYICVCARVYVVPSGAMWQFLFFQGEAAKNSLFYSILRLPAKFEMTHHKPTKCWLVQCLQLVPAKLVGNTAFHVCQLHFTLLFLGFFRKPKMPHFT